MERSYACGPEGQPRSSRSPGHISTTPPVVLTPPVKTRPPVEMTPPVALAPPFAATPPVDPTPPVALTPPVAADVPPVLVGAVDSPLLEQATKAVIDTARAKKRNLFMEGLLAEPGCATGGTDTSRPPPIGLHTPSTFYGRSPRTGKTTVMGRFPERTKRGWLGRSGADWLRRSRRPA